MSNEDTGFTQDGVRNAEQRMADLEQRMERQEAFEHQVTDGIRSLIGILTAMIVSSGGALGD